MYGRRPMLYIGDVGTSTSDPMTLHLRCIASDDGAKWATSRRGTEHNGLHRVIGTVEHRIRHTVPALHRMTYTKVIYI